MFVFNYLAGLMDRYKARKTKNAVVAILSDGKAIFSSFGNDVYFSDFVNNCIDRIATEISKIEIISVVQQSGVVKRQNDDITRLFRFRPNPLQTTKDFLACCEWLRRKDNNCFVYPQYETVSDRNGNTYRRYTAFYPLNPRAIEIGIASGQIWEIKFQWKDGSYDILPYDEIVHLRWRRGKNTIIGGGGDDGSPDTRDLLRSVQTLDKVLQGLPASIEAGLKINGVYTVKTTADADLLKRERDRFEDHILSSKAGIIAVDLAGEFTPINMKQVVINPTVLTFLKDIVRERYGISAAILSGDYNGDQHAAFYQNCVEDFITEFEQAFSSALFSRREQDVGHRVRCYYDKVAYYSTTNKIQLATIAQNTGLMSLNQINDMFGIPPFEGGDRRLQSLNYVNVDIVDQYQIESGKVKKSGADGKAPEGEP